MSASGNLLPSWNQTPARQAIEQFVAAATDRSSVNFVPPEERIAVFDNDGTLWCEKPLPIQADFLLRRIGEMAQQNPALRDRQPWKAVAARDYAWLSGAITKHYQGDDSDLMQMADGLLGAYEGTDIEEFAAVAAAFMRDARHPTLSRLYRECAFQPMIELLRLLEANEFKCYIASGGGRDFVRTISQDVYGIPPDRVIGSSVALEYRDDGDVVKIVHTAKLDIFDEGPGKPVRIWSRIGRRPILAGGNANGDLPMLRYAAHPSRPSLSLIIRHDDGAREFSYDAGAEKVLDEAITRGWTVVSMEHDWKTIFAGTLSVAGGGTV